jgi:enamine deaminase RidA (YjgF/YER057c/UK114 family)
MTSFPHPDGISPGPGSEGANPLAVPYHVPIDGFSTHTIAQGAGTLVFVSGITARGRDGGIVAIGDPGGQARQILANLAEVLSNVGGSMDSVRQIRTYVTDIDAAWPVMEPVWREHWPERLPASTLVQVVRLFDVRQLVETDAIAFLPAGNEES